VAFNHDAMIHIPGLGLRDYIHRKLASMGDPAPSDQAVIAERREHNRGQYFLSFLITKCPHCSSQCKHAHARPKVPILTDGDTNTTGVSDSST
jgi:hypothetical protein